MGIERVWGRRKNVPGKRRIGGRQTTQHGHQQKSQRRAEKHAALIYVAIGLHVVREDELLCSDQRFVGEEPQIFQPWVVARDALDGPLNFGLHFRQRVFAGFDVGKPSYHDPL